MNFIKALWRGEKSLSFTFWRMGVLGWLVFRASNLLMDIIGFNDVPTDAKMFLYFLFLGILLVYLGFINICIWRSAGKYINDLKPEVDTKKYWAYLARLFVVLGWFILVIQVFVVYYFW